MGRAYLKASLLEGHHRLIYELVFTGLSTGLSFISRPVD